MNKIFFTLLFLCSINVTAQYDHDIFLIPQGMAIGSLNGYGTSNLFNDVSNIGSINPAALNQFDKNSIGVSYQFESGIDEGWFAGIGRKRVNTPLPQSAGIVYPLNDFRFGLSMEQYYNNEFDIGKIPITTFENPEGTGEFFTPIFQTLVHNYSFITSYKVEYDNYELILGANLKLSRVYNYEEILNMNMKNILWGSSIGIGAIYKSLLDENYYWSAGLSFDLAQEISGNYEARDKKVQSAGGGVYIIEADLLNIIYKSPSKLNLDFELYNFKDLRFLGGITYFLWENIDKKNNAVNTTGNSKQGSNTSSSYKNQLDFSVGVIHDLNKKLAASLGVYYSGNHYSSSWHGFQFNPNLARSISAVFITAGVTYNISGFILQAALADSHFGSHEWRKQTIGKLSAGYSF